MHLRTNLAKAKGLGSSKSGYHHWLMQRMTAVILVIVAFWLIYFLAGISQKSAIEVLSELKKPYNLTFFSIFILTSIYHGNLGLQVVIEDYVHNLCIRNTLLIMVKLFSLITAFSFIIAVFHLISIR